MRLLINKPMVYETKFKDDFEFSDDQFADVKAAMDDVREILTRLAVAFTLDVQKTGIKFKIIEQKICLDELNMNRLFGRVLIGFWEFEIVFAYLCDGGADFTLYLKNVEMVD